MSIKLSIGDLTEYILDNRKDRAFVGDSFEQIAAGLQENVEKGTILYTIDDNDTTHKFTGVIVFKPDTLNKIVFVSNLVITKHSALVIFVNHFKTHFPGYDICAMRQNEFIMYNTNRLVNLLTKINTRKT